MAIGAAAPRAIGIIYLRIQALNRAVRAACGRQVAVKVPAIGPRAAPALHGRPSAVPAAVGGLLASAGSRCGVPAAASAGLQTEPSIAPFPSRRTTPAQRT